jgi:hypothetical protein
MSWNYLRKNVVKKGVELIPKGIGTEAELLALTTINKEKNNFSGRFTSNLLFLRQSLES